MSRRRGQSRGPRWGTNLTNKEATTSPTKDRVKAGGFTALTKDELHRRQGRLLGGSTLEPWAPPPRRSNERIVMRQYASACRCIIELRERIISLEDTLAEEKNAH